MLKGSRCDQSKKKVTHAQGCKLTPITSCIICIPQWGCNHHPHISGKFRFLHLSRANPKQVKCLERERERETNKVGNVTAIAKSTSGTFSKINPIRREIALGSSDKVIVVAIIHQRVTKNKVTRDNRFTTYQFINQYYRHQKQEVIQMRRHII